jgi:hypothetical protein
MINWSSEAVDAAVLACSCATVIAQTVKIVAFEGLAGKCEELALGYNTIAVSVKLIKNFLHGIGSVSSHGLGEWRELRDRQHAVAVPVQVDKRLRQPRRVGRVISIAGYVPLALPKSGK